MDTCRQVVKLRIPFVTWNAVEAKLQHELVECYQNMLLHSHLTIQDILFRGILQAGSRI